MKMLMVAIGAASYYLDKLLSLARVQYLHWRYKRHGVCVKLNGTGTITDIDKIKCGSNVHIGQGYYINSAGGVEIGDNVHISRNMTIYSSSHNYCGNALPYDDTLIRKKVVIEKNVWIGINVTIIPGAYLEEGCIVGAGAVVFGRISKGAVVGAAPASTIKMRDMNHYEILEKGRRYGAANGVLESE